jgi:tetratricopeptide (TPR) repeat protein
MISVDELKSKGNAAFTSGNYQEALKYFTNALELDHDNAILLSNRSGAYTSLKDYSHALEDAERVVNLRPDWAKVGDVQHFPEEKLGLTLDFRDSVERVLHCTAWETMKKRKRCISES